MLITTQIGMGYWLATQETKMFNRTGATLRRGEVAMVDLLDTQAEVTSIVPGEEASVFANLTPVTQAALELGFPILVCLDESVADNKPGRFAICGVIDVAVLDDDVSTTDIDKGDSISMLVSESAIAVQQFATGAGAGNRVLGLALQDAAASSSGTYTLKKCIWTGGLPCYGAGDT